MSRTVNRQDDRFFDGDEKELQAIKNKESLQRFVKHTRTRKRFSHITYLFVFGVLVVVFMIICLAVFFRVKEVEVVGTSRYTAEEILSITGIKEGMSLYEISDSDLESVYGRLAYIREAEISRKIPHTLVITVAEDEPFYVCELYGEHFILSRELRVLEHVSDKRRTAEQGLVELVLPEINSAVAGYDIEFTAEVSHRYVEAYLDVLTSSSMLEKTTAFDLRDRFNLALIANDIYLVKLGNGDELGTKLAAVSGMLDNEVFSDGIPATIDANDPSQCPVIKDKDAMIKFED